MSFTEAELLRRVRAGDERGMKQLYDLHAPRLYAVVRRISGEDALAHDWCQEVWIRALNALPSFRQEARFGTWLYRIAFNTAISLRRKQKKDERMRETLERARVTSHEIPMHDMRAQIDAALARLPGVMRSVLVLHDIEGYKHEEIAAMLGVQPATSRSQLFKARVRMQEFLTTTEFARTQ